MFVDANEIFAAVRVSPDDGLLKQLDEALVKRLSQLVTSGLGPNAHLMQPGKAFVQTTDANAGPFAQAMTGPSPAPSGGVDVYTQAEVNQETEEGQRDAMRGPGPLPVAVNVGPVDDATLDASHGIMQGIKEAAQEEEAKTAALRREGAAGGERSGQAEEPAKNPPVNPQMKPPRPAGVTASKPGRAPAPNLPPALKEPRKAGSEHPDTGDKGK